MRPYQYRCNDYSLLTPPFKRWIISPLIRFVPWVIPANIITLISNFFVYISLYASLHPQLLGAYTPLFIAACLLLYLIGDHLDGMQAKRTGTGSALGEFCDHYLDAFNNGIIVFTMFTIFGINHAAVISAVIVVSYLAHMAVFYEQFKTGWLTFERISSLEGVLLSALLIGLSTFDPFYILMTYRVAGEFSVVEVIMIISAAGAFSTFIKTLKRTPEIK
jgi:phosphatidylglycerophosphate synthase